MTLMEVLGEEPKGKQAALSRLDRPALLLLRRRLQLGREGLI